MQSFIEKHKNSIIGVLSGWDRIVFRGTLRLVANLAGMCSYLAYRSILMKDFKQYALDKTSQLIQASVAKAEQTGRPNGYLHSSRANKEQVALDLAARDGIREGLICILRTVEPCMTYKLRKNRQNKTLDWELFQGKCMHLYHDWYDACFGFMGARIQTWFPFAIQMWMNGREWLARKMDQEHLAYRRCDNCFPWIADFRRAQDLMDQLHSTDWCRQFGRIARFLNPAHETMFAGFPLHYYWTSHETEWATDIAFDDSQALARIYPQLVRGSMMAFGSKDVLRFLGKRLYPNRPAKEVSAKLTYLLRLLREHKIIRRLPKTRKYRLTPNGAKIIATISLTQKATTEQLNKAAA
jgi:hypothetical protein